jgi:hypothetical protein
MKEDQFDHLMMLVGLMIAMYDIKVREPNNKDKIERMMRDLLVAHDQTKAIVCNDEDWRDMV